MAGFADFGKRMGDLAVEVTDGSDRIVRKTVLAVDQAVVMSTPVDRGRARSNWVAQLDEPYNGTIDPYAPGEGLGVGEQANAQAALAQAASVSAAYDGDRNSEVHITNNLPYIERLNDGYSAQAPAEFVEEGVREGVKAIKEARLLED
jgi:hypothetical protein